MARRVFDPLAFEPDLALLLAQPSEILSSRPRRHHASDRPAASVKPYAKVSGKASPAGLPHRHLL
jgi:hypothetical protein